MDLQALYQDVIIDHNRNPHNFRKLAAPDSEAQGYNPLCGDKVTIYLQLDGNVISDASFQGAGCAISTASASLLTDYLKGKTREQAEELFRYFQRAVVDGDTSVLEYLGKMAVLTGVKDFPARVKCATLAWHTVNAALERAEEVVSTE